MIVLKQKIITSLSILKTCSTSQHHFLSDVAVNSSGFHYFLWTLSYRNTPILMNAFFTFTADIFILYATVITSIHHPFHNFFFSSTFKTHYVPPWILCCAISMKIPELCITVSVFFTSDATSVTAVDAVTYITVTSDTNTSVAFSNQPHAQLFHNMGILFIPPKSMTSLGIYAISTDSVTSVDDGSFCTTV